MQITEPQTSSDQREQTAAIEVEVDGRWDALALSELLIPFRSFLVQEDQDAGLSMPTRQVVTVSRSPMRSRQSTSGEPTGSLCLQLSRQRTPYERPARPSAGSGEISLGGRRREQAMKAINCERTVGS